MARTAGPDSAGVSIDPSQPSPNRPTRRSAAGADPASQISSGFAGSGPTEASDTEKNRPLNVTGESDVSSRRSSVSDSSNTAARSPAGTGNAARSAGIAGMSPNTGSTRAGASPASDASCFATRAGCRPGSTEIPLPAFSRFVRDSANAIPVSGSTAAPYRFSGSHSESTPAASSRSTADANAPGAPSAPSDKPMRTFTAFSLNERW
jgi:hypothetical protein